MSETTIQLLWDERNIRREFRCGVSLHSHTMYSEESLEMIPRYTGKVPFLCQAVRGEALRYQEQKREKLDFSRAFWTPPLSPRQACRLEQKQIERTFDLPALVSLTDHDDIRAGAQLRVLNEFSQTPVSTEWTIPFGPTFFHLGVHNIPAARASEIMREFQAFTAEPRTDELYRLLESLNALPEALLVLNHPLWDEKGIGVAEHAQVLGRLLERHGRRIHALELNGLRSWKENQKVVWLGRQVGLPAISGGDRHGLEPNAIVNLTRATHLAGFVDEIRHERRSHIVFMPQYREPLKMRVLQTMVDVVREYPDSMEGRRSWADRVCYRPQAGAEPIPLSRFWPEGKPFLMELFVKAMRVAEFRGVRSALRLALNDRPVYSDQEATT